MKMIEKVVRAFVVVAAFVAPSSSGVWAVAADDDDFAPIRTETMLSEDQIEELMKLGRGRGASSSKTTFSASETKEYSKYLVALFFVEFDRKLLEYKQALATAYRRDSLGLPTQLPDLLSISIASSEDVKGKGAKIASSAKPFVHIYAGKSAAKKMERLVTSYFTDDVEFEFIPLDGAEDDAPIVVACNPRTQKWTVWMEFKVLDSADTDLNLYFLSEGPIFGPEFEAEKKRQHVLVLKQRLKRERERALKAQRDAERGARASERNARRKAQQNALINQSMEFNSRGGR